VDDARQTSCCPVFYRRKIEMPYLALGTSGHATVAAVALPRNRGVFSGPAGDLNNEAVWGVTVPR